MALFAAFFLAEHFSFLQGWIDTGRNRYTNIKVVNAFNCYLVPLKKMKPDVQTSRVFSLLLLHRKDEIN